MRDERNATPLKVWRNLLRITSALTNRCGSMAFSSKNARHYFTISALVPTQADEPIEVQGGLTFVSALDRAAFAAELAISGGLAGVGAIGGRTGLILLSGAFAMDEETNTLALAPTLEEMAEGEVHAQSLSVGGKNVVLAGSFETSGAYAITLAVTAETNVTLPTSGKLANEAYVTSAIAGLLGGVQYQGTWNASSNTPNLPGSPGPMTKGHYYVVSVAGITNRGGILDWQVGDWLISNGASWSKVDNTEVPLTTLRTASFTASSLHGTVDLLNAPSGQPFVWMPALAGSGMPNGFTKTFVRAGGTTWTIRAASGETIDGAQDLLLDAPLRESVTVVKSGAATWAILGRQRPLKGLGDLTAELANADVRAGDLIWAQNSGEPGANYASLAISYYDHPQTAQSDIYYIVRSKPEMYGYPITAGAWYNQSPEYAALAVNRWGSGTVSGFLQVQETHVYSGGAYGMFFLFYIHLDWNGANLQMSAIIQLAGSVAGQTGRVTLVGDELRYMPTWDQQDVDGQVVMTLSPHVVPEF